jgi:hypothetical protein
LLLHLRALLLLLLLLLLVSMEVTFLAECGC